MKKYVGKKNVHTRGKGAQRCGMLMRKVAYREHRFMQELRL